MNPEFYSLETLILMHLEERLAGRTTPACFRPYCDRGFLDALANEENQ
jgi:hypothetical protein